MWEHHPHGPGRPRSGGLTLAFSRDYLWRAGSWADGRALPPGASAAWLVSLPSVTKSPAPTLPEAEAERASLLPLLSIILHDGTQPALR